MRPAVFEGDEAFWFETLRSFSHAAYGGSDFGEVLATAQKIKPGNFDSWHDEWLALAERIIDEAQHSEKRGHRVSARDSFLRASNYYRMAEFFLHANPADPRITIAFDLSVACFRSAAALFDPCIEPVQIPFEGTTLPGYFYRGSGAGARPTVVIHSGFDGTVEENHFFGAAAFAERGYHVLSFDGPGQPGMMHREGMVFRPDWETVVGPVLDYLLARPETDPDRVALMGISLGGVLASRAAAFDPRIKALVAFDGVYNLGENPVQRLVPGLPELRRALLQVGSVPELDASLAEAMAARTDVRWGLQNGAWVLGTDSPRKTLLRMLDFNVADGVAEGITCPTLVCSGASDLFLAGQPEKLYEHLTCPKTLISFTAEDAADAHVQVGAMRLACSRIGDWLDGTFSTAPAWPAGSGLARGRAGGVGDRDETGLNEASKT
jgi:pimeloyl-ACP methyl ester carboxylesterase